jgi:hypothetical protein
MVRVAVRCLVAAVPKPVDRAIFAFAGPKLQALPHSHTPTFTPSYDSLTAIPLCSDSGICAVGGPDGANPGRRGPKERSMCGVTQAEPDPVFRIHAS